jgi:hypothetical protein
MQFDNRSEVEPINSQGDSQREVPRPPEESPEEEPPIVGTFWPSNTQPVNRPPKSQKIFRVERASDLWWPILTEKGYDTLIIESWSINMGEYLPIAIPEGVQVHYRNDIGGAIHVISRKLL